MSDQTNTGAQQGATSAGKPTGIHLTKVAGETVSTVGGNADSFDAIYMPEVATETTDLDEVRGITTAQFLGAIFSDMGNNTRVLRAQFDGPVKDAPQSVWYGQPAIPKNVKDIPGENTYYCPSEIGKTEWVSKKTGKQVSGFRRWSNGFVALRVIVLDDIKAAVLAKLPPPTYVIETSADNYQVGFKLNSPLVDLTIAKALHNAIHKLGYCDSNGNNPVRWVRLPVGRNVGKHFDHKLCVWSPDTTYGVEALVERLGLDMSDTEAKPRRAADHDTCVLLTGAQIADARTVLLQMREVVVTKDDGTKVIGLHIEESPWHEIIGTLAIYGEVGFELVNEFSVGGNGYSEQVVRDKIADKLNQGATGIGQLMVIAARYGIENPGAGKHKSAAEAFGGFSDAPEDTPAADASPKVYLPSDKPFRDLVKRLNRACCKVLGDGKWIDEEVLAICWSRSFATSATPGGAVYFGLLEANGLISYDGQKDFVELKLPRTFPEFRTDEAVTKIKAMIAEADAMPQGTEEEKRVRKQHLKELYDLLDWGWVYAVLIGEFKLFRKVKSIRKSVDMFSQRGQLTLTDGEVHIQQAFKTRPLPPLDQTTIDMVVADYKQHFPDLDDLLDLILNARFAVDRKEAFVWLHAMSDWGKGFFMEIFAPGGEGPCLGLGAKLTVETINKAITGETVSVAPGELDQCWIVFIDEWKGVSRHLKEINSSIHVAPKYYNRELLSLYCKFFMSAEAVASMIEDGIEDQFNNRFAYLEGHGKINDRPLFNEIGSGQYHLALCHYTLARLTAGVERMRALGPVEAGRVATAGVHAYRVAHCMADTFGSLDDGVAELAREVKGVILKMASLMYTTSVAFDARHFAGKHGLELGVVQLIQRSMRGGWVKNGTGELIRCVFVTNPAPIVSAYLNQGNHDKARVGKLGYKTRQVANLMSSAGDLCVPTLSQGRINIAGRGEGRPENPADDRQRWTLISAIEALPSPKFENLT